MVTHSMDNILSMQYYAPANLEEMSLNISIPPRKKRCLNNKEVQTINSKPSIRFLFIIWKNLYF